MLDSYLSLLKIEAEGFFCLQIAEDGDSLQQIINKLIMAGDRFFCLYIATSNKAITMATANASKRQNKRFFFQMRFDLIMFLRSFLITINSVLKSEYHGRIYANLFYFMEPPVFAMVLPPSPRTAEKATVAGRGNEKRRGGRFSLL